MLQFALELYLMIEVEELSVVVVVVVVVSSLHITGEQFRRKSPRSIKIAQLNSAWSITPVPTSGGARIFGQVGRRPTDFPVA